jgi:hypothetical protein
MRPRFAAQALPDVDLSSTPQGSPRRSRKNSRTNYFIHRRIAVRNTGDFVKSARLSDRFSTLDPLSYPQARCGLALARFRLRAGIAAISSVSDQSRLVLPNVTIPKVKPAWACSRYQRRATWQI